MSSVLDKIIPGKDKGKKSDKKKKKGKKKGDKKKKKEKKKQVSAPGGFSGKSVIKKPWITEKARDMNEEGKYVFIIDNEGNKSEVKKEIEQRYDVSVEKVNVLRQLVRPSSFRGREGRTKIVKKAIVTLKEGDSINIFPV